jgi:8-oxo-dGTP pyrophosphatase MutT (NUDIX family)
MKRAEFDEIRSLLESSHAIGEAAHEEVFPRIAKFRKDALAKNPNPKLSAVASIFIPKNDEMNLLMIERQSYDGVHSGQVGFPGGKVEQSDADLEHTARRETEEEVGIPTENLFLVRALTNVYIPPSGFLVSPYIFWMDHEPTIIPAPREVQSTFFLPVQKLIKPGIFVEGDVETGTGTTMKTRFIEHDGRKIWGATAMMLSELRILLTQISK